MISGEEVAVTVTILSPKDEVTYLVNNFMLDFTVTSIPKDKMQTLTSVIFYAWLAQDGKRSPDYRIDYNFSDSAILRHSINLKDITDGGHNLQVTVSCTLNQFGKQTFLFGQSGLVHFTVKTATPPIISILSLKNVTYHSTELPLDFTLNEAPSLLSYSLDGGGEISMQGNTTLSDLSYGAHRIKLYATDVVGNNGTSETIYFSVTKEAEPFSVVPVAVASVAVASMGAGLLFYFRKRKRQALTV